MKVSILVCCYNSEKYISKCIDSILSQTYKNTEVIIYDDASSDNTVDILNKYYEYNKKINIIYGKTNKGVVFARNILLDNATGDLISFVDSDDTIEDDRSALFVKEFIENKDLILCGSNFNFFYENKLIWISKIPLSQNKIIKNGVYNSFLGAGICYKNNIKTKSVKFRKIFNKKSYEDVDLILRISKLGKFKNISKPLYNYRISLEQLEKKINNYDPSVYYMKDLVLHLYNQRKVSGLDMIDSNDNNLIQSYLYSKRLKYSSEIYEYKYKISLYLRVLDRRNALKKILELVLSYPMNKITLLLIIRYILSYFNFFTLRILKL